MKKISKLQIHWHESKYIILIIDWKIESNNTTKMKEEIDLAPTPTKKIKHSSVHLHKYVLYFQQSIAYLE